MTSDQFIKYHPTHCPAANIVFLPTHTGHRTTTSMGLIGFVEDVSLYRGLDMESEACLTTLPGETFGSSGYLSSSIDCRSMRSCMERCRTSE